MEDRLLAVSVLESSGTELYEKPFADRFSRARKLASFSEVHVVRRYQSSLDTSAERYVNRAVHSYPVDENRRIRNASPQP